MRILSLHLRTDLLETQETTASPAVSSTLDYIYGPLATKLNEERYIYGAYGAVDGLNLALTIPKLGFELCYFYSNVNYVTAFHSALGTPEGVVAMVCGGTLLIGASILGGFFSEKDDNWFQRNLAIIWPYIRDMLKALKWAFKGVRNTFAAIEKCTYGVHFLLLPIGVTLAALSIFNRMWYRAMKNERKVMQDTNDLLTKQVQEKSIETITDWQTYKQDTEEKLATNIQTTNLKTRSFMSAAFAGAVEGLYFYFATATLAVFIPPIFISMLVLSTFLTLSYICSRMFEEYDFQRKLLSTALKTKVELCKKEIMVLLAQMEEKLEQTTEYQRLEDQLQREYQRHTQILKELEDTVRFSYGMAILDGVKHGLTTQGVISSLMICVVTLMLLLGIPCPPIFIIVCVLAGVSCILYCIISALKRHHDHLQMNPLTNGVNPELEKLIKTISTENFAEQKNLITTEIQNDLIKPSDGGAPYYGVCEILRQVFSGGIKGPKAGDEIMHADNHYVGVILWLSIGCSYLIAAASCAGRALAKEFGTANEARLKKQSKSNLSFFQTQPETQTADGTVQDLDLDHCTF